VIRLKFTAQSKQDVAIAKAWYREIDLLLLDAFNLDLKKVLAEIQANCNRFSNFSDLIKEASLKQFPYLVYFRIESVDEVSVLAVIHHRQDSDALLEDR
jgi:hypothetical protein